MSSVRVDSLERYIVGLLEKGKEVDVHIYKWSHSDKRRILSRLSKKGICKKISKTKDTLTYAPIRRGGSSE